ncbi:hypothetical protein WKI68_36845 [Streptomyces sp. MS1.HAVA.3]|uniref:Uncharacterized protein n=1 Tax=Streptomyces caledonius TaxID=3134107 RepID=A0ABU8UBJ8_9ACTN
MTRLRLTCLYGGVFMMAGTVLLAVVFLLAVHAVNRGDEPVLELGSESSGVRLSAVCSEPGPGVGPAQPGSGLSPCVTHQRQQTRDPLVSSIPLALVALGLLSTAAGYVTAGYALSPLRRITHGARRACPQDA